MKCIKKITCCFVLIAFGFTTANAQLYKINLDQKIRKASLVVEGRVAGRQSFWNNEHSLILTSNKIHVYKLFKGNIISADIEVITQGGSVGNKCLKVSDVVQLNDDEKGMFFLYENAMKIKSPLTKNILYDVYSSEQGFLKYSEDGTKAFAPYARYNNVQALYNLIKQRTGISEKIIDNADETKTSNVISGGVVSNGTAAVSITSFSPATVHAGALNDDANNILTINGSGFGSASGSAAVKFKDANSNNTSPGYKVDFNSPYIISWADNKIVLNVPDRAGTGKISVTASDGTSATSSSDLQVFFAVLDAEFNSGKNVVREPRLMNTNGSGGYTILYSASTKGNGIDFMASSAKPTFERALATWKEIAGANLTAGNAVAKQAVEDDDTNLVVFDNDNIGVPHMADGVLESTYSWFSACVNDNTNTILTAQKTGFDIILRNDAVSTGSNIAFEYGPCFPALGNYDLEMIILHELGHALNLSHINDDYEDGGNGYPSINPSKLMHYSILDYVDRRSPDAAAYQGVLYTITPQNNMYGSCGLFANEMTPLPSLAIANDECPSTFPSTPIDSNTTVAIDLIHATSNKFSDPSFKQINCKNSGTSITNNAYYAFSTGAGTSVTLDIENYTTSPSAQSTCNGQTIRLALYDVQSCPSGQSFPQPVLCNNFSGSTSYALTGLQPNHKYLLYFDGVRNTKASFNAVFNKNGSISNPGDNIIVKTGPNPVDGTRIFNVTVTNAAAGSAFQYAIYDAVGRRLATGILPGNQTTQIEMKSVAAGVYFLRVVDEDGKKLSTVKILKP